MELENRISKVLLSKVIKIDPIIKNILREHREIYAQSIQTEIYRKKDIERVLLNHGLALVKSSIEYNYEFNEHFISFHVTLKSKNMNPIWFAYYV